MKPRVLVSTSGGRTSAMMAWHIKQEWSDTHELVFVFANTGKEREETLVFVDRCSQAWGLGTVWVEAVVHTELGMGTTHRVVDYTSAARNGEPFEAVIQKYGIPNMNYLHCTRELKAMAIRSYMRSIGWSSYVIAQGMRIDEPRRIKPKVGVIYPLAHTWPTTKVEVLEWWEDQPFDLGLLEHQGNCDGCHKKNIIKLVRIAQEDEHTFAWWDRMETTYGLAGNNVDGTKRTFYRDYRSAKNIVELSRMLTLPPLPNQDELDGGCSESCEPFTDEEQ